MAKIQGGNSYSIITDHLGTPTEAYNDQGRKVWSRGLNIYGETRKETGLKNFIPYLYQGQYLDVETELAYNRYRYYSPESGAYVSQDPIGLFGGDNAYAYVPNTNSWVDVLGLNGEVTIVRLDNPDSPTNNHYVMVFDEKNKKTGKVETMKTHLTGGPGETVSVETKKTSINLDLIPDADKKVIPIKNKGSVLDKVKKVGNSMDGLDYDIGKKVDCYQYLARVANKVNPSINMQDGADNATKFKNISCG